MGALVDALAVAGNSPPESYLQIDRAGVALRHGDATPWKELIAQAKLGYGHLRHFSLPDEKIVSCNDYPLLWPKDATEAASGGPQLERKVRTYEYGQRAGSLQAARDSAVVHDALSVLHSGAAPERAV